MMFGDLATVTGSEGCFEEYSESEFKNHLKVDLLSKKGESGWVFGKQYSEYEELVDTSLVDFLFSCEVTDKIKHVLEKLGSLFWDSDYYLFQFWAPLLVDQHLYLTTAEQPFSITWRVDEGAQEEELGTVGRVYRNKHPKSTPDLRLYSTKEFPLQDAAACCGLTYYLALPVFDLLKENCNGVIEVLSMCDRQLFTYWLEDGLQVFSTVRAHGFEDFLTGSALAQPQFLHETTGNTSSTSVNPEYSVWIRRDQFLFSWLLSSISEPMLGHVNRCQTSAEIWSVLERLFYTQSRARIMHLRLSLQTTKKGDLSIEDYVLKMRGISDQLNAAGQFLSDDDLILYILGGLGPEFDSVVVHLTSRSDVLTLQDVQFALQTHEMRSLQRNTPLPSDGFHSANIAVNGRFSRNSTPSNDNQSTRGGYNSRGRGRGRSGRGQKPACQICGKTNHIASKCYKRFDISFTGLDANPQANLASTGASTSTAASGSFHNSGVTQYPADAQWYVDSGATSHVTANLNNLSINSDYLGQDKLTVGQAQSSSAAEGHP